MIEALLCLALIQPYEAEIKASLPGNASDFRFEDCRIADFPEGRSINVQSHTRLRQNVCKWGQCVTVWSYSSTVFGMALVDDNCDLKDVRIWSVPRQPLLDPLIPKAVEGVRRRWPEIKNKYSELCP